MNVLGFEINVLGFGMNFLRLRMNVLKCSSLFMSVLRLFLRFPLFVMNDLRLSIECLFIVLECSSCALLVFFAVHQYFYSFVLCSQDFLD